MIRLEWPNSSTAMSSTAETELLEVYSSASGGHRGMTFIVYSSAVAATATVKYIEPGGGERILTTASVAAGSTDATVIDIDFSVPQAKLYVTMGSSSASTVTAEGMIY